MTPAYLDAHQAAAFLGVGLRTIHKLRKSPDFPKPRTFSDRATRWKAAELEAWADSRPCVADRAEPAELTRARAAKRGVGGSEGGAGGGLEGPPAAKPRRQRRLKSKTDFVPPEGRKSNPNGAAA